MTGRGAWNTAGVGGTRAFKNAAKPGPYYFIGTGRNIDRDNDFNELVVWNAVKSYQRALNRRLGTELPISGFFGLQTRDAVLKFQRKYPNQLTAWGGIGQDTSRLLFMPDLRRIWRRDAIDGVPVEVISGTIRQESLWDAGAVGYLDDRDVGLGQINMDAHPGLTLEECLRPVVSFKFVVQYYNESFEHFGNIRDAVASYNLGRAGARRWIDAGRPDQWAPSGGRLRNVKGYIDNILQG